MAYDCVAADHRAVRPDPAPAPAPDPDPDPDPDLADLGSSRTPCRLLRPRRRRR
jgi:hypothetical protein